MYTTFEKLLRLHNCKAADVARATGIAKSTLTEWKNGKTTPKADKLQKIADYFGVTVEYLLTGRAPDQEAGGVLTMTDEEQLLLSAFRQLNGAGQAKALELVKLLLLDPDNKPEKIAPPRWINWPRARPNIYVRTYQLKR